MQMTERYFPFGSFISAKRLSFLSALKWNLQPFNVSASRIWRPLHCNWTKKLTLFHREFMTWYAFNWIAKRSPSLQKILPILKTRSGVSVRYKKRQIIFNQKFINFCSIKLILIYSIKKHLSNFMCAYWINALQNLQILATAIFLILAELDNTNHKGIQRETCSGVKCLFF